MDLQNKIQSKKKSILHSQNNKMNIQIAQLQKSIDELSLQNKNKYEDILKLNPKYSYKLYKANDQQLFSKVSGSEILLRQMDRLLDEKSILQKELSLIKFQNQSDREDAEKMVFCAGNPYQILKKAWNKSENGKYQDPLQHIEDLNYVVGLIKGNIINLTKIESQNSKQSEESYIQNLVKRLPDATTSKQCLHCLEKEKENSTLKQKLTKLEADLNEANQKIIELNELLQAKQQIIKKLNKENATIAADIRSKTAFYQQKLLLQDRQLRSSKKFKSEVEKLAFVNLSEGFTIYLKSNQQNLQNTQRQTNVSLQGIFDFLEKGSDRLMSAQKLDQSIIQPESNQIQITEFNIPLLKISSEQQNAKKTVSTDRPRGQKFRSIMNISNLGLGSEDMEQTAKKYIRTASSRRVNRAQSQLNEEMKQNILLKKIQGRQGNFEEMS